tara:strand:- start:489 stop:788 length:300 start_codon:yes stop_codon:yes gene_type:complete
MIVIGIIYVFAAIILIVAIVMGSKKLKNQRYSSDNDILSVYQYSEIVIGTVLFFILFIAYQIVINGNYNTLDIVYSTLAFGSTFALGKIVGNWVDYNHN